MNSWTWGARLGLVTLLLGAAADGSAQTIYRCRGSNGTTIMSQQPCTTGPGSQIGVFGPQETRYTSPTTSYSPVHGVGKAPDHLNYLSAECATLNDAIRTGPARGVRGSDLSDLHHDYRKRCGEEDAEARQRVSREHSDQRNARKSEQMAQKFQKERSAIERDQCHELLRILHAKRQRVATMSEGEKADLANSETAYRARCAAP
jgi:Domain of unknown function (DUF4124)